MLVDTNGDGIVDYVAGKVVVPAHPTASENAAAADLAARIGFATTGLTPPIVISATDDHSDGARIYVGGSAAPVKNRPELEEIWKSLEEKEGGVFDIDGSLAVLGRDEDGLLAAAEQFASHAPFVARMGGPTLSTLGDLKGVTYLKGFSGAHRAFLRDKSIKTLPAGTAIPGATPPANAPDAATADAEGGAAARLDLATLYTMRGLFRGSARMPIPSNLDGQLYVPAGLRGSRWRISRREWEWRPLESLCHSRRPRPTATASTIRTKSVVDAASEIGKEAERKLREEDTAAGHAEPALAAR